VPRGTPALPCPIRLGRVIEDLRSLLGAERVLADPDVLAARSHDTWPLRLLQAAIGAESAYLPLCVVLPASTEDVATVPRFASAEAVPVVPYGGGSGVLGGAAQSSAEHRARAGLARPDP